MDPFGMVAVKLKEFGDFTQEFFNGILRWQQNCNRRKPIEILKRLQREAFSDIMKLRDRQDKVERILSFYKSSKGSPFQEAATHIRGNIDMAGAMFLVDNVDNDQYKTIQSSGIRTGLDLRLVLETSIRQKDTLVAEFVAAGVSQSNIVDRPLALSKVLYAANVCDWFSAVAIPLGARCRDVGVAMSSSHEENGFSEYSAFGPPFLNQMHGSALGLMVRKSNICALLGHFVSGLELQQASGITHCFSTFGQVVYELTRGTKLSLLGLHKVPKISTQQVNLGAMAIPFGGMFRRRKYDTSVADDNPEIETYRKGELLDGSLALMLESELDGSTRVGGWIEMKQANSRHLQWAVTLSDTPEDDIGWGVSMGGLVQGPRSWDHFQVEAFLNFNFGKQFRFQPAVLYLAEGTSHFPAILLRSGPCD